MKSFEPFWALWDLFWGSSAGSKYFFVVYLFSEYSSISTLSFNFDFLRVVCAEVDPGIFCVGGGHLKNLEKMTCAFPSRGKIMILPKSVSALALA